MRISGFFLIGYPGENEDEIEATISFARELPLDLASFLITMPLPGSLLWDDYRKDDHQKIDWKNFVPSRVVAGLSDISPERLKQLQRKATILFYIRVKIITRILKEVRRPGQYRIIAQRLFDVLFRGH